MKKRNTLIIALSFAFTFALFGQDFSSGRIYSAQGNDFVILRDGTRIIYDANRLNEEPIAFLQGDIFQTGQQSSADIQFGEKGPLLKIVENSSVELVRNGSTPSAITLNLYYGRIRTRIVDGEPAIHVASKNGLVEVTQGDAGIDYIVRNDLVTLQSDTSVSAPVLYVTNFNGETNVFPADDGTAVSMLPQLLVREGETVSVEFVSSLSYVERNAVGSATSDYWRIYDFAPLPVSPSLPVVEAQPAPAAETVIPDPVEPAVTTTVTEMVYTPPVTIPEYETLIKRKNSAFITTLVFLAGALVLGGTGMYFQYQGNADRGYFFTVSAALVAGVGAVSLFHGLSIDLDE
jgi:hypothetical protein